MSESHLVNWIESILFGNKHFESHQIPCELNNLFIRMESENIPWAHIILNGGFTAFVYQVHGDLNTLVERLEIEGFDHFDHFQTRAVSRFWKELQILLARREEEEEEARRPSPKPDQTDQDILKLFSLNQHVSANPPYQSASFWGEVARRCIHFRKPMKELTEAPHTSFENFKRVMDLYDVTCQSRGEYHDPFAMHLVPHAEYVDAVHWKSDNLLESFMHSKRDHVLTRSVQGLLLRTLNQFVHGQKPSALLNTTPEIDALLHNIQVVHTAVQQVPNENEPPKLVDVFQRLLALSQHDELWDRDVKIAPTCLEATGTDLFYMTQELERERRKNDLLWRKCVNADASTFVSRRIENTC
jgi:hypothetical protein